MATAVKLLSVVVIFSFLTVITQVGGIVYLISLAFFPVVKETFRAYFIISLLRLVVFSVLYLLFVFLIVPQIAQSLGRVPLPLFGERNVKPLNVLTVLCNRHYVKPEMKQLVFDVASGINKIHPGTTINYLDANFPFFHGFPLWPHLSHNDGKKLDVSFLYRSAKTGRPVNDAPSFIGYGICEEPRAGEENKPAACESLGYSQYSLLRRLVPQESRRDHVFDEERTRDLVLLFAGEEETGKIFLEPHLRARLRLSSTKIRFHGCQAVRHDDHLHIQLR